MFTLVLLVGCLLAYGSLTLRCSDSWNDLSRMAAIQSLVERNDWRIAPSDFAPLTFDKVFIKGHFYSDKTPTLSWIGAGVYATLRNAFGVQLAPCAENSTPLGYYGLTVLLVGSSAALLLVLFMGFMRQIQLGVVAAFGLTSLMGFATEIFPYSLVFNHHVPSATAIFASFVALYHARQTDLARRRFLLLAAGFLAGLAATFDLLAGIFAVGLFVLALARFRRQTVIFVLGAVAPIALMIALDYQMIESPWPPYMATNGYKFPGSRFPDTVAGNRPPRDSFGYMFAMLVGNHGWLAYCPLLFFALLGLLNVVRHRKHELWLDGIVVLACSVALLAYLGTSTSNFGGTAYGMRWLVVVLPLWFVFVINARPFSSGAWPRWLRASTTVLFCIAAVLSFGSAAQGALQPWRYVEPPLYLELTSEFPYIDVFFTWQ
ncbi:MAG: hypothetical protein ABI874_13355 [Chloroflexota bacterium]